MTGIRAGSKVSINYIGTLDNGKIFHATPEGEPLVFTVGSLEVFPMLESAVTGMKVGEVRNVVIPAADAYGPRFAGNIIKLDRGCLPAGKEINPGQKLAIEFAGKGARTMVVVEVTDTAVTLDGNHPLAGQDLTFAVQLEAIG